MVLPRGPEGGLVDATGGLQARLAAAGLAVAVVGPRRVRDLARATGRLARTDRLDAEAIIARFARAARPEPRPLDDAAVAAAANALAARRRELVAMRAAERGRRASRGRARRLRAKLLLLPVFAILRTGEPWKPA